MECVSMQLNHRADVFAQIIAESVCTDLYQNRVDLESGMNHVMTKLSLLRSQKNTLYIIGNGGSAAVASHALIDFVNVAKINTQVLQESSLITCMANDFGYEQVYSRVLSQIMKPDDILMAISSSGQSANICKAAQAAKAIGAYVITFTGFSAKNLLNQLGDLNFWLDSLDYGYVEVGHQFILHNLSDRFGLEQRQALLVESGKAALTACI